MTDFTLSSSDFSENQLMGATFQADHPECASPQLSWSGAPAGTKGFAIAMHDPDAPTGGAGWWHWMLLVLPADVTTLARGAGVADSAVLVRSRKLAGQASSMIEKGLQTGAWR